MPEIIILGSTDITLAVAQATLQAGVGIAAIANIGSTFNISYSREKISNARYRDISSWCSEHQVRNIPFTSYDDLIREIEGHDIPLCLVAGWYHMVPRSFRDFFPKGCLGFHASLLPQLRGGAPLNWAILSGLKETGVSLFEMDDGVDTGRLYAQSRFPIGARTKIGDLVEVSQKVSAEIIHRNLAQILSDRLEPYAQNGEASYGLQRQPADSRINWNSRSQDIDSLIRATSRPYPGAFTTLNEEKISIWSAEVLEDAPLVYGAPGQIFSLPDSEYPCVVTGDVPLKILEATDAEGTDTLKLLRRSGHQRFSY